jgi:TolB-like protein/class 3 adenylate cyclase
MSETRKIAAILVADVVGYSRLAGADEEGTLARLRALRSDLIDPALATHRGRIVNRTGDGSLIEFRSVVDAVRCAIEVQNGLIERNAGLPAERRIEFRVGIHLGDVVEETDGDLMGDGVNIAARLEGIAKPGAICLSEQAYWQVKGRLDLAVSDLGPTQLKNIAEPIRVYSLEIGAPADAKPMSTPAHRKSAPPRLSIVVLPFANIGGGGEQEHFVDGVTESLTTDLSRIRGAYVVARNTAFTFKGKPFDVTAIGRELNVRYVLEGSVQRGGNRMRVNVQLMDAETGNHLWAERFDKPLADLFDMQDEIVARLAGALNVQLAAAEARRAELSPNADSMDLYFQGMARLNKGQAPDHVAQARSFFDRALAVDPDNVAALIGSAAADFIMGTSLLVTDPKAALVAAEAKLTKALSSVPDHARAHSLLGLVEMTTKRASQGVARCEHALELDRNLADAHAYIGLGKIYLGRAEETEAHIAEALRLSPRDTLAFTWMHIAAVAKNNLGLYEQAVAWCRRAIEANRNYPLPHFVLGSALAQLGRLDEARSAVKAGLALNPAFSIARARAAWLAASDDPTYQSTTETVFEGMRKAGVPNDDRRAPSL